MNPASPRVFVVDDDPSLRKSLCRLLSSVGYEAETFASALDFLEREACTDPCCLVLDVQMPGPSGIELQARLAAAGRHASIVFLTGHADVPMSVAAMKAGAVDLLTKPVDEKDLLDAVERALARDAIRARAARLTPREHEVFERVVNGLLNKQIAAELELSEKTVKVHRARVMRKMQAGSVAELVRMADRVGMSAAGARAR